MVIFKKNKIYTFKEIINICNKNGLAAVDCRQDDNKVSVEKEVDGYLEGDCLFEFTGIDEDIFKLTWVETDPDIMFRPNKAIPNRSHLNQIKPI